MLVAMDCGYGAMKVVWQGGQGVLPSHVAVDGKAVVHAGLSGRRQTRPMTIGIDDGSFYVGAEAHSWGYAIQNLDLERFLGTTEMRVLLYGAFSQIDELVSPVQLIVGMPLEFLSGEDADVRRRTNRVKRWLRGEHCWRCAGQEHRVVVADVKIGSQVTGTMFDYFLDDAGEMVPARIGQFKREVGIVNIGMNTVDMLVVSSGKPEQRLTSGSRLGVRRLLDLCDGENLYTIGELDQRLRSRTLTMAGALSTWSRDVIGFIERQWGKSFRRFGTVVCAGGGTIVLQDALVRHFGAKIHLPDDPVIVVARGLFKYALMKEARRGRRDGQTSE